MSRHYFFATKLHKFKKKCCCHDCCHGHVLVNFNTLLPHYYKYVIYVWSVIIIFTIVTICPRLAAGVERAGLLPLRV